MLLQVGELARRTGLTVRTLHHYDEIGLLRPSGRSDGGYRLYAQADVARLHAIQALRGLGLALDEIGRLLADDGASLPSVVDGQLEALEAQIRRASELRDRLRLVQAKFRAGTPPDLEDWLATLALMTTSAKYFSADEMRQIFGAWAEVEQEFRRLAAEIRALKDAGVAPLAPEMQPLAQRWMGLMHDWMQGDFERMERWSRMFHAEPSTQGRAGVDRSLVDFIEQAVQQRLALLGRHVSRDELRRIGHVPQRQWRSLAEATRSLIEQGVPPDSDAARELARRRDELLDRLAGGDAALREKLQRAYDAEPLLRQGGSLPPDVRAYLMRVPSPTRA